MFSSCNYSIPLHNNRFYFFFPVLSVNCQNPAIFPRINHVNIEEKVDLPTTTFTIKRDGKYQLVFNYPGWVCFCIIAVLH